MRERGYTFQQAHLLLSSTYVPINAHCILELENTKILEVTLPTHNTILSLHEPAQLSLHWLSCYKSTFATTHEPAVNLSQYYHMQFYSFYSFFSYQHLYNKKNCLRSVKNLD